MDEVGRRRRPVHINLEQCQPPDLPYLLFELDDVRFRRADIDWMCSDVRF